MEDAVSVNLDGITVNTAYADTDGGVLYGRTSTVPAPAATVTFLNAATFSNTVAGNNGGVIYVDNSLMDVLMNIPVTVSNSKAVLGSGGVFYIKNGRRLELT